jgi:hypothetical protein
MYAATWSVCLDKLDALHLVERPRRFIHLIVEADTGQTKDQAIARWCGEHPDDEPLGQPDDFIILNTIVSPNAKRD